MAKDFSKNLRYLYECSSCENQELFAEKIGINRSTLSRLATGARAPRRPHLDKLAAYAGLANLDDLMLDHAVFRRLVQNQETRSNLVLLSLRSVRENLVRCESAARTYGGQYIVYYRSTEPGSPGEDVVASLLTVLHSTNEGVRFEFVNPYRDPTGDWSAFQYSGYLYLVSDFLYLIGEQTRATYEVLSLVIHTSPAPQRRALRGLISGIGVKDDRPFIAARPIVAIRRQKSIGNWRDALRTDLGYLPEGRVPEIARRELSSERITIL